MGRRLRWQTALVAALAFAVGTSAAAPLSRSASLFGASGHCSTAAADHAAIQFHLEAVPGSPHPVAQVLCGEFLGSGVEAMVASLAIPSCGGTGGWAAFRYTGGSWKLAYRGFEGADIAAVGSDIKETQNVLRPSDSHCFPKGGTRSRIRHWSGSTFPESDWRYSQPARRIAHIYGFRLPGNNLSCSLQDGFATCVNLHPPRLASLQQDGSVKSCSGSGCVPGSMKSPTEPGLDYGQRDEFGGFGCELKTTGITCIGTASAAPVQRGRGFVINAAGVTKVGP